MMRDLRAHVIMLRAFRIPIRKTHDIVDGANGLLRQDGNPLWRLTTSLTWRLGNFGAGVFGRYVSSVYDTGATLSDGTQFVVDDWAYANVYVQYTFDEGAMDGPRFNTVCCTLCSQASSWYR